MTEFMGMVYGRYDAKSTGFAPGGASLHSCMTAHGPDAEVFLKASTSKLEPEHFTGGLAFMLETTLMLKVTPWALGSAHRDLEYQRCWQQLPRVFDPAVRDLTALVIKPHAAAASGTSAASADSSVGSGHGGAEEDNHKRRREVN